MLDLVDRLARQPVYLDLLHILLAKLLEAQDHHVVVHSRKFASVVVLKHGHRCASFFLPSTALDGGLRGDGAHWIRRLLRLHTRRQQVPIDEGLHSVKALLVGILASYPVTLLICRQVELLGEVVSLGFVCLCVPACLYLGNDEWGIL